MEPEYIFGMLLFSAIIIYYVATKIMGALNKNKTEAGN